MTRPILWENINVSSTTQGVRLIKRKTVAAMIVAALIITSVLAFFHNLESSFQNKVQQITNQLESEKSQQRKQLDDQLQKLQQDNKSKDQQIQDLQKQVSLKKQQQAQLAAAQAAQQAAQSVPSTQVASSGNCAAYEPLVAQYGWNVHIAMAIMQAESGCNPTATSPTCDHGLMQINCVHAAAVGGNLALLNDPATNVRVAYQVYQGAGWSAWTTYTSGAYLRYLS